LGPSDSRAVARDRGDWCGPGFSASAGEGFHDPFRRMPSIANATGGRCWSIPRRARRRLDMADATPAFTRDERCPLFWGAALQVILGPRVRGSVQI
jgi:hypothetical protein